jgi:hypothetical protein
VSDDTLRLRLPPQTEHLGTARSFAAAVARHYTIAGEAIEDLKVAITEACVDAIEAREPIQIDAREQGRALAFSVEAPSVDAAASTGLDEVGAPARIELIRALFPDTAIAAHDGRRSIRFSVPLD